MHALAVLDLNLPNIQHWRCEMQFRASGIANVLLVLLTTLLAGCAGYLPGEKAYWDARVKEFCERDGHVQIIERVVVLKTEAGRLPKRNGNLALRMQGPASEHDPLYLKSIETNIKNGNPRIRRTEWSVVNRRDGRVVARWFSYGRIGGDFPSHAHSSSFACPEWDQTWAELQALFIVKEE